MSGDSPARIRELLALYRRTHYEVRLPDGAAATLRVGENLPARVAGWLGADDVAVYISACNPCSRALADADNAARMDALRARLRTLGARWLEGSAGIPGEDWREASLLVAGIELSEIDRLARDFGQDAVLVAAHSRHVALRLYRDDWRAHAAGATDLDWAAPA